LLWGDRVLAATTEEMGKGQAERLMPLIADMLGRCGRAPSDLGVIGVGTGPGNFTGIRISVAAARGLALALGVPAVGVSGLEALALDGPRPLLACLDARRDHVYLQRFGPGAARGPKLVPVAGLSDWADAGLSMVGPPAPVLAGPIGAVPVQPVHARAVAIARIAATRAGDPHTPRPAPLYLRAADAAPAGEAAPMILPS
jgi:tRNA threonylcarbamoyl adenosine modification protein YeaZ